MPDSLAAAVQAWRDADANARASENLLAQAWQDYEERNGPAVSADLINEVARLRDVANDRLTVALSLMKPRR